MNLDKYQTTINTFGKLAEQYQEKYLENDVYQETYDDLLGLIDPEQIEVLDIGCGPGSVSLHLAKNRPNLKFTGFDPAEEMVVLARTNLPDANLFVLDARDLGTGVANLAPQSFDIMVCGFCIPYLDNEDVAVLIRQCAELSRGNGLFYLSFMADDLEKSRMFSNDRGDEVFIHYHDADQVRGKLTACGFEVIYEKQMKLDQDNADTDIFFIARRSQV